MTTLRFGVVLKRGEGFLKKLTPSFQLGLGAILGDGEQMMSWIHSADVVGAIQFLLQRPQLTGPFNLTAPHPITQRHFAQLLAKILHRPLWLTLPASVVRTIWGEMGEALLLSGQAVLPKRLEKEGYRFLYPDCEMALRETFS